MNQKILLTGVSSLFIMTVGAFLLFIASQVGAVSINYQLVSPRISGIATNGQPQTLMGSSHSVSGDGRYIVFSSISNDIVVDDNNNLSDIFVRDTETNTTKRVSVSTAGIEANAFSSDASISYDGAYIVFRSSATNLVDNISSTPITHIYMHNLSTGETTLIDKSAAGDIGSGHSSSPKVSAEGRFVVFSSQATNLVPGFSSPINHQVYVKDVHSGAIKALSVSSTGVVGNGSSINPDISCDGGVVVFATDAENLGGAGVSGRFDLTVVHLGWDNLDSRTVTGGLSSGIRHTSLAAPQVSCDGNKVLFVSSATNAVSPSTPSGYPNAYTYNRLTATLEQVSLGDNDVQSNSAPTYGGMSAAMSYDGRYVAFTNRAGNMDLAYPQATGSYVSLYIRDTKERTTDTAAVLVSGKRSRYIQEQNPMSLDGDGSMIAFGHLTPTASNANSALINGYTTGLVNGWVDIYKTQTEY